MCGPSCTCTLVMQLSSMPVDSRQTWHSSLACLPPPGIHMAASRPACSQALPSTSLRHGCLHGSHGHYSLLYMRGIGGTAAGVACRSPPWLHALRSIPALGMRVNSLALPSMVIAFFPHPPPLPHDGNSGGDGWHIHSREHTPPPHIVTMFWDTWVAPSPTTFRPPG